MKQLNDHGFFINSEGIKSTDLMKNGKVREYPKDATMPKKSMSVLNCYIKENFSILKEKNP